MQDSYAGNIGDYAKYSLLRALVGWPQRPGSDPALSLSVVWFRHCGQPAPEMTQQSWRYLSHPCRHEKCDPGLFERLQVFTNRDERRLCKIECGDILPPGTDYRRESICASGGPAERRSARCRWLNAVLGSVKGHNVVFLDPDVGLAPRSQEHTASPRHVYPAEVERFLERDTSWVVVVYQYLYSGHKKGQLSNWERHFQEQPRLIGFKPPRYKSPQHAFAVFRADADRLATLCEPGWFIEV